MYRIHIDIQAGTDKDTAVLIVNEIVNRIRGGYGIGQELDRKMNYRLGHDEDRQKSNHLDVNENGHVSCKKIVTDIM
jgi:hypothetical protein